MYKFSNKSRQNLEQCHEDLQTIFNEVIKTMDCTILCGYRNEKEQNKAFNAGHSKLKYPKSRHNKIPSLAVDVLPFPVDWKNIERIADFGRYVKTIILELQEANKINHLIIWGALEKYGGDWKKLNDMPHWELGKTIELIA